MYHAYISRKVQPGVYLYGMGNGWMDESGIQKCLIQVLESNVPVCV